MFEDMNFALYLNILFFGLIGLGMLFGFIKGLKHSLYSVVVRLIFYVLFFATLTVMVNIIWDMNLPYLSTVLGMIDGDLSNVTRLSDALPILLEGLLGEQMEQTLANPEFMAFAESVGLFIVKLVYTIFYFTIFKIIYNIIFFIIRIIFFKTKKGPEYKGKKRLAGAAVGAAGGIMSIYIFLILFGGMMSITDSFLTIVDGMNAPESGTELSYPPTTFDTAAIELPEETLEELDMLRETVDAYHGNAFVSLMSGWTRTDDQTGRETPVNLHLFDMVFSIDYRDHSIALRNELAIASEVFVIFSGTALNASEGMDLSELNGEEVRTAFATLSSSDFFVSMLPLGIELAADYFDTGVEVSREELYAIDWRSEVNQLGEIVASVIDIITAAGAFEDPDALETHVFDGDDFRNLFNEISESEMITLAAYTAMVPMLERAGDNISVIMTVPEDLRWEDEFKAFGEVIGSILDTEVTLAELREQDFNVLFDRLSALDFQVILESRLISQAMINMLSGKGEFGTFDQMLVPDDIEWMDTLDDQGEIVEEGELRLIMIAFNAIAAKAGELDFEDENLLSANLIAEFDSELIGIVLNSEIFAASVGNLIYELGSEQDILSLPQSILTTITVDTLDRQIVNKDEIISMVETIQLLNIEDLENGGFGANILQGLADEDIPKLFDSKIIHATLSTMLLDLVDGEGPITVPHVDFENTPVREYDAADDIEYITVDELSNVIKAFLVLEITESFDAIDSLNLETIIQNIETLLDSAILHATVSTQLIELAGDMIEIPHFSENAEAIRFLRGSGDDVTEFILKAELTNTMKALESLGVLSLDGFEGGIDLESLFDATTRSDVLASSILQATISKQLIDTGTGTNAVLVVPHLKESGDLDDPIRITVGDTGQETEYIVHDELETLLNALVILGLTQNLDNFDGNVDLLVLQDDANRSDVLDSSILQATISKQVFDLEGGIIEVPHYYENDTVPIRIEVGDAVEDTLTTYVTQDELDMLINAVLVIGVAPGAETFYIGDFDGSVDLEVLTDVTLRNDVLSSGIIQATLSKQMLDRHNDGFIHVPHRDGEDTRDVRTTIQSGTPEAFEYILKAELDYFITAMLVLDLYDVEGYDGSVNLIALSDAPAKNTLLDSAVMHATISKTLLDLSDGVLIIPELKPDGNALREDVAGTEFVIDEEIRYLIDAFIAMDYTDLDSFGTEIASAQFFDERATLLLSASIQATISDKMLNDTGGKLIVPDEDIDSNPIRIPAGAFTYIDKDEMDRIFAALELLDLKDFNDIDITPAKVFASDAIETLLESASIQLTISDLILDHALHESDLPTTQKQLVVSSQHRQTVDVDGLSTSQISHAELTNLLYALEALGVEDFTGGMDSSIITTIGEDITTLLESASMHLTIDNMLKNNANIAPYLPDLAIAGTLYNVTDVISASEIEDFIVAADTIGADFTDADFSLASVQNLAPEGRETVADSMIVRNKLTIEIENQIESDTGTEPGDPGYPIDETDYEEESFDNFLKKQPLLDYIENL